MLNNFRIFTKVFISQITVATLAVVSLSLVFYFLFQSAILQRTIDQLSSINILKRHRIEEYLNSTQKSLEFELLAKPFTSFATHRNGPPSATISAEDIEQLKQLHDAEAILIADRNGRKIIGTENDSLLMKIAAALVERHDSLEHFKVLEAFEFIPVNKTILIYVLPIVFNGERQLILIQDKFEKIQRMLGEMTGMGNSGESYLVGADFKMRSASRFFSDQPPLSIPVNTEPVKNAFAQQRQGEVTSDYRGVKVLSYYAPIEYPGLNWALISEIDYDEAMKPLAIWITYIVGAGAAILMAIFAVTYFIANSISRPILYLKKLISSLSKGVIPNEKVAINDGSEIGQIAKAIEGLIEGLERTTEFADEIGQGNFDAPFTTLSSRDTLGLALLRMRDQLRRITDDKIKLVREKASALLEGQENERKRIVRELHDGVGQLLTAIRLQMANSTQEGKMKQEILDLVNETIREVKQISYDLMPNAIVDFGLEAALQGLCDSVKKTSPITIDYRYVREFEHTLSFEVCITVYRIVQEAFNNILKHSGATHSELHILDNEYQLYLLINDNGRGFDPAQVAQSGFGLRSMQERSNLLNGTFEIHSTPGKGTELEVVIPMRK